jgi:predicted esterase
LHSAGAGWWCAADYKIQDDKFHTAGVSNGGIAALHVAAENPHYFLSVTAFPGFMWQPSSERLERISKMCVFMYVGENDPYKWHNEMKKEAEYLHARSRATPSSQASRTGWTRSQATTLRACSMALKRAGRDAAAG